jgi:hypothetical protein
MSLDMANGITMLARSWMPELMRSSYTSLKRLEQELADAQTPAELCRRHAAPY